MVPARRLVLPLLVALFFLASLFLAKKAFAIWFFDFDSPTLCPTFDATGLNQTCPAPGQPPYPTLTTSPTNLTLTCDDGTSPWSSGCKELTYTILFYKPNGTFDYQVNNKTCQDEEACDVDGNAINQIKIQESINPDSTKYSEVRIQYWARDKAGNRKPNSGNLEYRFNFYPYKITGFVWVDTDQNEVRDVNPQGRPTEDCYSGNVTITLSDTISAGPITHPQAATCNTYSFNVPMGIYTVTLTPIPEYGLTGLQTWAKNVAVVDMDREVSWGVTDARVWWQTKLGDVRAGNGSLTNPIPARCRGQCYPYVSLTGNSSPGIIFYATTLDINSLNPNARASLPNWRVQSGFSGTIYSYDYVNNQVSQTLPFTGAQPGASGVYKANGDVTINTAWSIAGQQIVILVNGNLTVNQEIHVAAGSFLAFYVKGNIIIDPSIGSADNQDTPQLEGIFVSDGSFNTGTGNRRLNIEGTVVAQSLSQNRNIRGGGNLNPAFYVFYRPDFLLSALPIIQKSSFIWQEVAP